MTILCTHVCSFIELHLPALYLHVMPSTTSTSPQEGPCHVLSRYPEQCFPQTPRLQNHEAHKSLFLIHSLVADSNKIRTKSGQGATVVWGTRALGEPDLNCQQCWVPRKDTVGRAKDRRTLPSSPLSLEPRIRINLFSGNTFVQQSRK